MALTKVKLIADGVINVDNLAASHGITTDNIGEGLSLYYTDDRVSTYLTANEYATQGFVTTAVSNLVQQAPSTLDTLNELAAALGDDPNFATTVTNSIAGKLPLTGGNLTGSFSVDTSIFVVDKDTARVGVGIEVPEYKLDVDGTTRIKGNSTNQLIVTADGAYNTGKGTSTLFGYRAGYVNTANANVFIGYEAGRSNTSGFYNSFYGYRAGYTNSSGFSNSLFGYTAGYSITNADFNSFFGTGAGYNTSTGNSNTFIGEAAGYANTTGYSNLFEGAGAGNRNTTGYKNSFIGSLAGYYITTGYGNSFLGYNAGKFIANGSTTLTNATNSVFIGLDTKANADSETNQIVIGYNATGLGSNTVVLGNDSIAKTVLKGNVGIGTTATNYGLLSISSGNKNGIRIDTNSGYSAISISGNGSFSIDAPGVENGRFVVTDDGKVGIGATNPEARLDVVSDSGGNAIAIRTRPANDWGWLIYDSHDSSERLAEIGVNRVGVGSGDLYFTTYNSGTGSTKMIIKPSGNVGIGTTSPGVKLEVLETSTSSGGVAVFQRNIDAINEYAHIKVGSASYPAYFGAMLGTYDMAYMSMSPDPTDGKARVIRTVDGNVGIGTTNPVSKLQVENGDIRLQTTSGDPSIYFGSYNISTSYPQGRIVLSDDGVYGGNFDFYTKANGAATNGLNFVMRMRSNGHIGIGTSNPRQKLDIAATHGQPATSGTTQNGVLRMQVPSGVGYGETLDMGMSVAPSYAWIQSTNADSLAVNYSLALNPNGGNVGIGIASPADKLHVNGVTRIASTTVMGGGPYIQMVMDGTKFSTGGPTTCHIKTSILKGSDTMIAFNVRGYHYSPETVDTDIAFYCYQPISYLYGVTIYEKSFTGWDYGLYYSSDNYVCIYVTGMTIYSGFTINWINTGLIQWSDKIWALATAAVNTIDPQF